MCRLHFGKSPTLKIDLKQRKYLMGLMMCSIQCMGAEVSDTLLSLDAHFHFYSFTNDRTYEPVAF